MFGFKTVQKDESIIELIIEQRAKELFVLEMAMESGIDLIAKTISKCEIKVVRKSDGKLKEIKDENYYRLNIRPNVNEVATTFWRKAIHKLLHEEELLIVVLQNGDMFIASDFTKSADVINGLVFENVKIEANGNSLMLNRSFEINECLYISNCADKIKRLVRCFQEMYAKLIGVSIAAYSRSNAVKVKASFPGQMSFQKDGKVVTKNEYFEEIKKQLNSEDFEVLISSNGLDYNSMDLKNKMSVDDVNKLMDKAIEITAFCLDIPYDVFVGKSTEKSNAQNDFITFSIDPLKEVLEDSLNAFGVSKNEFLQGEKFVIDTTRIMHRDILDAASNLDKLFAQGFNHNEICELTGKVPIDEDWAYERYVTKNYSKGGEKSE